jgi:predicted flap endonuclease-1-like 5' DNA nuclease
MAEIETIEGIGSKYAEKLSQVGVATTQSLLEQGATRKGRQTLVEQTGISAKLIMEWVNLADLFRVKGIGEEYADLLEAAGVDTVPELAQRNPENLYEKLKVVNTEKHLTRRVPSQQQVKDWVAEAKELPRIVTY